jgi:tetratricopeptide (TPR) repeat protein
MIVRAVSVLLFVGALSAQGQDPAPAESAQEREAPPKSEAARAALDKAEELAKAARGKGGPELSRALEVAAGAYDGVAAAFAAEPAVAAEAAWTAAELWRRQGSLPLAEKDYLFAADKDPVRYGQRGLLGAADMQRRQERTEDAMKTYARAEKVDPRTSRAQDARLWQARLLLAGEQVDAALTAFQAALESAPSPSRAIEAANFLAGAWIQKGDLDAAERAIEHARKVADAGDEDPVVAERLKQAFERMSARRALQRARDEQNGAGADAVRLDEHRRKQGGSGGGGGGEAGGGNRQAR